VLQNTCFTLESHPRKLLLFWFEMKPLLFVYYFVFGVLGFKIVTVTYVTSNRTRYEWQYCDAFVAIAWKCEERDFMRFLHGSWVKWSGCHVWQTDGLLDTELKGVIITILYVFICELTQQANDVWRSELNILEMSLHNLHLGRITNLLYYFHLASV
jgi:hypothetical protein